MGIIELLHELNVR